MENTSMNTSPSVLLIYTGGTIGMMENPETGLLEAFEFEYLEQNVPELKRFGYRINAIAFNPVLDSSEVGPESWVKIAETIEEHYDDYDGFVVLHGTDTMAFTASALSFMLDGLSKPVVLTGSQLPIGKLRTDGKENLITAIEIAATKDDQGNAYINEVCILFDSALLRGNRCTKTSADLFNAFSSPNYPALAQVGINIHFNLKALLPPPSNSTLKVYKEIEKEVLVLRIFPGLTQNALVTALQNKNLRGVILETFGSGNAPSAPWFIDALKEATDRGVIIVNVSQCMIGCVEMQRYETGNKLLKAGVISGYDSTTEAALVKLMLILGQERSTERIKGLMNTDIRGEISKPETTYSIPHRRDS